MCRSIEPGMLRPFIKAVTLALALPAMVACLGIKPPVFSQKGNASPWAGCHWSSSKVEKGILVKVHGILTTEESLQHFDLDFPRLGILPVLVHIEAGETGTFSWNTKSFTLTREGRSFHPLPFSRVEKTAFRHYGIKMYSDKEISDFRNNFASLTVKDGSVPPKGVYLGLLYFSFPASAAAEANRAVIAIEGKDSQGRTVALKVVLLHD